MMDSKIAGPTKHLAVTSVIWAGAQFWVGSFLGLMDNARCFKYLGCNEGFFGFDAVVHFLAGILYITFVLWLFHRYPKFNILHKNFWKNVVILLAISVFTGLCWEIFEFGVDHLRIYVFHQTPSIQYLFQASNSDTMGDLIFGLLGSCSAIFTLRFLNRKKKE